MVKKRFKRCSTSLAIRELHHKTIRDYHIPIRKGEGKKANHTGADEDVEQLDSHTLLLGVQSGKTIRKAGIILIKLDIYLPYHLTILILSIYPKELKTCLCKNFYKNVHSSLFIVAQNWKQPECLRDK